MYNVVFRTNLRSSTFNAVTWVPFIDKKNFDEQYSEKMQKLHKVIEQNSSKERAVELCSTAGINLVIVAYKLREP
ncbi:MAG: hypothetical protein ABIG73_01165 [Patescibacteria group bacterium]